MIPIPLSHPTPQFRRDSFLSLDGEWLLNGKPVRVPFPPQAPLSGWEGPVPEQLVYEKDFTLPKDFLPAGFRLLLHFGAVDQTARILVNGKAVAEHRGGYLPFEADITAALRPGANRLRVEASDTLSHFYPYGKQSAKPHGMWYTPVSGIWQSVWLEAVPERRILSLKLRPELDKVRVLVRADQPQGAAEIVTPSGSGLSITFPSNTGYDIPVPDPRPWSPDSPELYGLTLRCGEDTVYSYFALRTVKIAPDSKGIPRLMLNGRPVFLSAVLDQGYFPDGLFLPESPERWLDEARRLKDLGFNCDRKHIKLEPEAFYCACDMAGVLVIQDMVNAGRYGFFFDTLLPTLRLKRQLRRGSLGREQMAFFEEHCRASVSRLYNHPCIIGWTLFNEGWGQFDTARLYRRMKQWDSTRFTDSASGWYTPGESDLDSVHVYFKNRVLKPGKKPLLLSECGGYTRAVEGHLFKPDGAYGYGKTDSEAALTDRIEALAEEMIRPAVAGGLCGYVYTQITDVEGEINGLYTYDRQVLKADAKRLRSLNRSLAETLESSISG